MSDCVRVVKPGSVEGLVDEDELRAWCRRRGIREEGWRDLGRREENRTESAHCRLYTCSFIVNGICVHASLLSTT